MAMILEFPAERISRDDNKERKAAGETAELLFFTGVRYSRSDGGPVHAKPGRSVETRLEKRTV